jgi:hypothetical protein
MTWQQEEIENTVLNEEELKAAILEGKRKKWFKEQHKDHWPIEKDKVIVKEPLMIYENKSKPEKK